MTPNPSPDRDFPWWLVILAVTGLYLFWQVLSDQIYRDALRALSRGIWITVSVATIAFFGACLLGLGLAVMGLSRHRVLRQAARLYIEVMRGVPILVLLLYVAWVVVPGVIAGINGAASWVKGAEVELLVTRDVPLIARAVIALMLAYSAFLAEIFRAGLQAVDKGQVEAAMALGLNGWQRFRLVRFPQAFRLILPPLGNDFVAMVKDSSLVAVLGIGDIAQQAKVTATGNFRYFETYNVAALIYLTMTIGLSLILRRVEARMRGQTAEGH